MQSEQLDMVHAGSRNAQLHSSGQEGPLLRGYAL